MFARPICRATAGPLRQQTRRGYASSDRSSGSRFGPVTYGAVGAVTLVAGILAYRGSQVTPESYGKSLAGKELPAALRGDDTQGEAVFMGMDKGFFALKLKEASEESPNTKRLRFELPEPDNVSGLPVASAILTKFKKEGDEKPTIRPYTPVSGENEKGFVDLIVKKYEGGPMSTYIHNLKPGDSLDFKGPIPKYDIQTNKHNHIAMIAGGAGITPMYQVARRLLSDPNDKTKVTLVFGNVTEQDILLRKELQEYENTYPRRFRVFYSLDKPPADWEQGKGFITADVLKQVLPEPKEDNIKIFVCGPPGLYKAISGPKVSPKDQGELEGALKELGYSKDQVFKF